MSTTSHSASPLSPASTRSSRASSGFRNFWARSQGNTSSQAESNKKKTSAASQKRRQQIYQAQKRHRDRKAEYIKSLEDEVARLQHLDSLINSQRVQLMCQNQAFREYFASQSLSVPFDDSPPPLSSSSETTDLPRALSIATVDVRFDTDIGQERTFMDLSDTDELGCFGMGSSSGSDNPSSVSSLPSLEATSFVALDFILALEWPCKDHHAHGGINPQAINPHAPVSGPVEPTTLHGHAMTMTAAVYQCARPATAGTSLLSPRTPPLEQPSDLAWHVPYSEIEKLIQLSEHLQLDEEQTTPAQAYAYVKRLGLSEAHLQSCLRTLKATLSSAVGCFGFGAALPTGFFIEQVNLATQGAVPSWDGFLI